MKDVGIWYYKCVFATYVRIFYGSKYPLWVFVMVANTEGGYFLRKGAYLLPYQIRTVSFCNQTCVIATVTTEGWVFAMQSTSKECSIALYYMASSASGQDEPNRAL